jgi:hypothetical protein
VPARADDSYRARVNAAGVCPNTDSTRREAVFLSALERRGWWAMGAECRLFGHAAPL